MGSFYEPLPYSVEHKGKTWAITPAFNNVLSMYVALEDCTDTEKVDVMLYFLLKRHRYPKDVSLLTSVCNVMFPTTKKRPTERCFDFIQDSDLIYAAFLQAYGIDLYKEQGKLHWLKFKALMDGLPSDTKLAEVISIRLKPLPPATKHNARERMELIRLKQQVALKISEEERQANIQAGLAKLANTLLAMGEKNG